MRTLALLLAALLGAPAAAQDAPPLAWAGGAQDLARTPEDFAARYRATLGAFLLPGVTPGDMQSASEDDAVIALLPSLEGTWLRGALALMLDPAAPDASLVAQACERAGAVLARTSPRSFEMRVRVDPRDPAVTYAERYDFLIGNTFLRSFDETGYLTRLLGADPNSEEGMARMPEGMVASTLGRAGRGEVLLFHPWPEVLVIAKPGFPADVWLRCG